MTPAARTTRSSRTARMLAHLPLALQGGSNIVAVLAALAAELTLAEEGLTRLMRSRWYAINRGWQGRDEEIDVKVASELGALAALFDLEPAAGETTEHFRRRLRDVVVLHRAGLTTAPAILQMAAGVYLSDEPPVITWQDDATAVATFTVSEPSGPHPVRLELVDNPPKINSQTVVARDGERFDITNFGFDPAIPEIVVTAPPDAGVAVPVISRVADDLRIIFVGKLQPGDELILRHNKAPLVNGRPTARPVIVVNPYTFGDPNHYESQFWIEKTVKGQKTAFGARFSVFDRASVLPALPTGPSRWRFATVPLPRLARYLDYWPDRDELMAADLAGGAPAPVSLTYRWPEAVAACFSLRVPADYVPWHMKGDLTRLQRALQGVLERGRAAGIEPRLELVMPAQSDALDVRDQDPAIAVRLDQTDAVAIGEEFRPGGPIIRLEERIAAPDERLSTTGFFDHTVFETSLYAKPKAEK